MTIFNGTFWLAIAIFAGLGALIYFYRARVPGLFSGVWDWVSPKLPSAWQMLPIWIVIGLSWFSTTTGVTGLMKGGQETLPLAQTLVVALLVFAATLMMVRFLQRTFEGRLWKRFLALAGYIFLLFISVIFGFAFYWETIESRAQTFSDAKENIVYNVEELGRRQILLEQIRGEFSALSRQAKVLSDAETGSGNVCEEGVGNTYGSRAIFLEGQRDAYAGYADRVQGGINMLLYGQEETPEPEIEASEDDLLPPAELASAIDDLESKLDRLKELENIPNETAEDRVVRQREFDAINRQLSQFENLFNALIDGPRITGISGDLSAAAENFANPNLRRRGPDPRGRIVTFQCYIPAFSQDIDRVLGLVERVRAEPLTLRDLSVMDGPRAVRLAFQRLLGSMNAMNPFASGASRPQTEDEIRVQEEQADLDVADANRQARRGTVLPSQRLKDLLELDDGKTLRSSDYAPLLFAIVVDMILLFWTLIDERQRRSVLKRTAEIEQAYDATWNPLNLLGRLGPTEVDPRFNVLDDYLIEHRGIPFIAVPIDVSAEEETAQMDRQVMRFVQMLSVNRLATKKTLRLTLNDAQVSQYLSDRGSVAAGRNRYTLWNVNKILWQEMFGSAI